MNRLTLFALATIPLFSYSQHNNELYNDGALIHIQSGAEVHVWGDVHMNRSTGTLHNDGLVKMEGNAYSDNLFQQRGTGTFRVDNSDVNIGERQFISGSYNVRGGQAQIGVNDGSFYHLELANDQGVVYLVGTGNIADVRQDVDFNAGSVLNRIITHDIGLTGAIVNPANGSSYSAVFGLMNPSTGIANLINNTVATNGNMSGVDNAYVQGKFRRAIAPAGGNYGFVLGVEPAGAGAQRGMQYARIDFAANNYDVITGFYESGSPNVSPVALECSGNTINYFGGADHGEWMFSDILGSGTGAYTFNVWPQDDNFIASSVWLITKDNSYQGTANDCGPTPVGLARDGFNGFNGPSEFDVAAPISPLPVELIKIWAEPKSNYIQVNWDVATEHNVDYYALERSLDGITFQYLTSIPAQGNSTSELSYSYNDYEAQRNQEYFYRYKGYDFDGTSYYSPIVSARLNGLQEQFSDGFVNIYPNPSSMEFNLSFVLNRPTVMNFKIYDAVGKLVHENEMDLDKGNTVIPIEVSDWTMGMYTIRINDLNNEEVIWKKIIKN